MTALPIDGVTSILCDQWLDLLDHLNIAAFTVDRKRHITAFNASAQRLMELNADEAVGLDCREVFTGVPCLQRCQLETNTGQTRTNDISAWNGVHHQHLMTRVSAPVRDAHNSVVGCLTILQDHSPLADLIQRIHHEERTLKTILENMGIGVLTVNRGGHITFINRAAETISGYPRRQVLGSPCGTLLGNSRSAGNRMLKKALQDGQPPQQSEITLTTRQGERVPVRASCTPLFNEHRRISGAVLSLHDMTLARQLDQVMQNRYRLEHMVGRDPAVQRLFDMVRVVAPSDTTVLIEGATGTGKDMLAKIIHAASRRAGRPMVKVNCAALPDTLLESEMFGYVRGAFTGADRDKPGRFQEADGGTLFLDEVGDLPLSLQAKLLRVLEEGEFYPLGGRSTVRVDVRLLSATNQGLTKLVAEGRFREDLFYRLNVVRLEIPPLTQRPGDLPLLIHHILRRLAAAKGKAPRELSAKALKTLLNYPYPGNVREMENILEHALILCQGQVILPRHLPDYVRRRPAASGAPVSTAASHPTTPPDDTAGGDLRAVLDRHHWNRGATARALGIDRSTLWRRMKRLGLLGGNAQ